MHFLSKLTAAIVMTTGLTLSTVEAAHCKIEGPMLLQAYSRALKYGGRFECLKKEKKDANFQFLPTPNGLICQHHKEVLPLTSTYSMKAFGVSRRLYSLKNNWYISDYRMTGGGTKIISASHGKYIYFRKDEKDNIGFKLTLQSMTLANKTHADCSDLRAVIRDAFGN